MTTKKRIEKLERKANPEDDEFRIVWVYDGTYQVGDEIMTEAEYLARYPHCGRIISWGCSDEIMTEAEYLARYGNRKRIQLKWMDDLRNEDSASDEKS
jgi:hypothetical protein